MRLPPAFPLPHRLAPCRPLALALLAACAGGRPDDSAPPANTDVDTHDDGDDFTCETPELHINGADPPSVGDYWEVLLWCDDTLMTGAMHMSIDPPEMATIEDNTMTFNLAGTGVLSVQVGTIQTARDVVVSEAP